MKNHITTILTFTLFSILICAPNQNAQTRPMGESGDWQYLDPASAPDARFGHTMVVMPDNQVLLFGGEKQDGDLCNDLHVFDQDYWSEITPAGPAPAPRRDHAAWVSGNGILVSGGRGANAVLNDYYYYAYDLNGWTQVLANNTPPSLYGHHGASTSDQDVLYGGNDPQDVESRTVYRLDFNTGEWVEDQELMPFPVAHGAPLTVPPGLVSGGSLAGSSTAAGGQLAFLGLFSDRIATFDLEAGTWGEIIPASLIKPMARQYAAYAQNDNIAWLFGGKAGDTVLGDSWQYDFATGQFTRLADMPFPLYHAAAAFDGQRVIVFGGKNIDDSLNNYTLLYTPGDDPVLDSYVFLPNLMR